jgi:hypothetical protein
MMSRSGTVKINLALDGPGVHRTRHRDLTGLELPLVGYLETAFEEARDVPATAPRTA